jgi:hypothetical protein
LHCRYAGSSRSSSALHRLQSLECRKTSLLDTEFVSLKLWPHYYNLFTMLYCPNIPCFLVLPYSF